MFPVRPTLDDAARWGSAVLVVSAGWAAGRGLAGGMDTLHAAAAGFSISGSIFLATMVRRGVRQPSPQVR